MFHAVALPVLWLLVCLPGHARAGDLLPDLIVSPTVFTNHEVVFSSPPALHQVRLANGVPNVGSGPFEVASDGIPNPDGSLDVVQRIQTDDAGPRDRFVGAFPPPTMIGLFSVHDWAHYRIRERLPNGDVGAVLASGRKDSFCLVDSQVHDDSLPGHPSRPNFISCSGLTQGVDVGWMDIYTIATPGQQIDVTHVPPGSYWLEAEADPLDRLLEENEDSNVARIAIEIPSPCDGSDTDADGYPDPCDNCSATPNGSLQLDAGGHAQLDIDADGIGNACDGDFNQDGFAGGPDFDLFLQCFNTASAPGAGPPDDPDCSESDMNGDGFVGGPDFDLFLAVFGSGVPATGCGLGVEIALVAPWLVALRRRRAARR